MNKTIANILANPFLREIFVGDRPKQPPKPKKPSYKLKDAERRKAAKEERDRIRALNNQRREESLAPVDDFVYVIDGNIVSEGEYKKYWISKKRNKHEIS